MTQAIGSVAGHLQIDREVVAELLSPFVIQPGHHQPLDQLGRRDLERDEFAEPIPGDEHGKCGKRNAEN